MNTPEQRYKMDSKTFIRKTEIPYEKIIKMSSLEIRKYVDKKMLEAGFNLDKKIYRYDNFDRKTVVYRQRKYIIPKRKKI